MVDDVFKNVQALKGLTVDEFMGTMGLMSASLGLCCSDCHPGAGTESVRWEDDSNPRKVKAREMVLMMHIGDTSVFLVQGNGPRGAFANLYFDRESGLLVRTVRYRRRR